MRLDEETPARKALDEFLRPVKRPRGRPIKTWFECVKRDLIDMNITLNQRNPAEVIETLYTHTQSREVWRKLVMCAVPRSRPDCQ